VNCRSGGPEFLREMATSSFKRSWTAKKTARMTSATDGTEQTRVKRKFASKCNTMKAIYGARVRFLLIIRCRPGGDQLVQVFIPSALLKRRWTWITAKWIWAIRRLGHEWSDDAEDGMETFSPSRIGRSDNLFNTINGSQAGALLVMQVSEWKGYIFHRCGKMFAEHGGVLPGSVDVDLIPPWFIKEGVFGWLKGDASIPGGVWYDCVFCSPNSA